MNLKALVRAIVRRYGYDIVSFRPVSSLASCMSFVLKQYDVNCILDVGGHHGEYGRFLREIGYIGHILSFEPVSESFAVLQQCAANDPRWHVHHMALGAAEGTQEIRVTKGTVLASFRAPSEFGLSEYGQGITTAEIEVVQVKRLDAIFADVLGRIPNPRVFLKMDTQGWDLAVLEGAEGVLPCILGLQSEVSIKSLYEGTPSYTEAVQAMEEKGFALTAVFPVAHDRKLQLIEVDCVLVRQ